MTSRAASVAADHEALSDGYLSDPAMEEGGKDKGKDKKKKNWKVRGRGGGGEGRKREEGERMEGGSEVGKYCN